MDGDINRLTDLKIRKKTKNMVVQRMKIVWFEKNVNLRER